MESSAAFHGGGRVTCREVIRQQMLEDISWRSRKSHLSFTQAQSKEKEVLPWGFRGSSYIDTNKR